MSDNTSTQTEQANQLSPCDSEVFSNGVSLGLFEMPKEKAESLCEALRLATGYKIDWHYFAGRAHIKALQPVKEDSELSSIKDASIEAICRAYQAEARAEHDRERLKVQLEHTATLVRLKGEGETRAILAEARAERAEADNARLTKMVDWLAEKQIRCAANGEQWYGPTISKELHVPMYPSKNEAIDALKEAARRAVAAGEETCQK